MSQYPVSLQVQLILLNFSLTLSFLVIHDADVLVSNTDYCGNLGLTCLHLCYTFHLPQALCPLRLHHSPSQTSLITDRIRKLVFHSWASKIWPYISFSTLFSTNKKQKACLRLVYSWNPVSIFLMQMIYPHAESCFSALAYSAPVLPPPQDLQSNPPVFFFPIWQTLPVFSSLPFHVNLHAVQHWNVCRKHIEIHVQTELDLQDR